MVLDPANGVAKGESGCLLLQHVRSSAVEEHDRETPVQEKLGRFLLLTVCVVPV